MKLPGLVVAKIENILFYYLLIHQRRAQILNVNIRFTQRNAERTVNFGGRITEENTSFLCCHPLFGGQWQRKGD